MILFLELAYLVNEGVIAHLKTSELEARPEPENPCVEPFNDYITCCCRHDEVITFEVGFVMTAPSSK